MRVKIQPLATKKETFRYLIANKERLIAQKKSLPITSDPFLFDSGFVKRDSGIYTHAEKGIFTKANEPIEEDLNRLTVRVVANTANFIDSHLDMILRDAPLKSINDRKGIIPHLHDHNHTLDAELGEVLDIYLTDLSLKELGLNVEGKTQALVFLTELIRDWNPKVFDKYKAGRIKQHSIGLQYVKLDIAINDPEWPKEYEFWQKYYDVVINKDVADQYGFFWVVFEYKLIENSAVLFGSNPLTPTLDNNVKIFEPAPGHSKADEPSEKDTRLMDKLTELANKLKN